MYTLPPTVRAGSATAPAASAHSRTPGALRPEAHVQAAGMWKTTSRSANRSAQRKYRLRPRWLPLTAVGYMMPCTTVATNKQCRVRAVRGADLRPPRRRARRGLPAPRLLGAAAREQRERRLVLRRRRLEPVLLDVPHLAAAE